MYWYIVIALGISGVALLFLIGASVVKDDRPEAIAPRPMFLVNLASLALLIFLSARLGQWLGFQVNAETHAEVRKVLDR